MVLVPAVRRDAELDAVVAYVLESNNFNLFLNLRGDAEPKLDNCLPFQATLFFFLIHGYSNKMHLVSVVCANMYECTIKEFANRLRH